MNDFNHCGKEGNAHGGDVGTRENFVGHVKYSVLHNYLHYTLQGYESGSFAQDTPIFRNTTDFEAGRARRYDIGNVYDPLFFPPKMGTGIEYYALHSLILLIN